jgi:nicotinamidase/pyrazinamidase
MRDKPALKPDRTHTAVLVVDVQGDFTVLKNGSLAVQGTDRNYIDLVNHATQQLKSAGYKIFATQDMHPAEHISFHTNHQGRQPYETLKLEGRTQMLWPPHCIRNTPNAEILIDRKLFCAVVEKGTDPDYDSYSGFSDDRGRKTELENILKAKGINTIIIYGLATDYCVKATAMDAVKSGFSVILIENLCRGVDQNTSLAALKEMSEAGIKIVPSLSKIIENKN